MRPKVPHFLAPRGAPFPPPNVLLLLWMVPNLLSIWLFVRPRKGNTREDILSFFGSLGALLAQLRERFQVASIFQFTWILAK